MVRLDVARDDREVMPLIGAAMGINLERTDAADLVAGAIGSRRVLLFLDNFEHVLDAAVAVSVLLERCPRLTLLVTSRMALALRAEHTVMVPPLGLPFEDERDPIMVMKWKETLDFLEHATDRCEDVANVLESVVVKHG